MKEKGLGKKLLSLLLVFSMLTTLIPSTFIRTVDAATGDSEPIYVLAGGDFQQAGDHAGSAENVTNILNQIKPKYETMDGFLFVGDYDCDTHNDTNQTTTGIQALMAAVQGKYSNLNYQNTILTQGNHDSMVSYIDKTGGHDFKGYSVYVLNEDDYPDGGGSQSQIQTLANNLKTWLNNKIGEGYDAPIFITSHLPLAFSPRTNVVGDGKYAKLIFDVLNEAADEGLNIIFMHGHNHAYGNDNYIGGEAIYLPVGEKINIAEEGSTTKWTEETLNFTYMNPGYVGYYNDWNYVTTEGTDKLTMTVFKIESNQVTVERYSANGLYNMKSEGRNGRYVRGSEASADSLGLAYNTTVYKSPQIISLGVVEDYGDIGNWVEIQAETPVDDVTTSNKGWVELIAPVPGTEAKPGTTTYKYVLDKDGVNTNTKYLIVNTSSNGTAYALTNNNGTVGRTPVTISNSEIIVENETNINWIFSGSDSGTVVNQKRYVYLDRYTNLSLTENGTDITISNQGNGAYRIFRHSNSRYNYLRYSSNSWSKNSTKNSNDVSSVYLFSYDRTITTPGIEAQPGTNGTYYKISGDLTYNATAGMTAEQAIALVQGGIDGYYYEAMSTPGTDVTGTKVDDSVLAWEWVDTFDGDTAGDYEVAIKYGEVLLGTAEVVVPATKTYYVAEGNGLYIVPMNTTEANAMAAVKAGVTVYSATDTSGTNKTDISDDDVTWNWVDKYNGADSGPYTVEILKDGKSLGTVEVKVNIQYETGINSDWTYISESEATGGSYTYTLDTDGINAGEKYIIVARNANYALYSITATDSTSGDTVFDCSAPGITISGNTATTTTRDYEYYFTDSTSGIITKDGSKSLYQKNYDVDYGSNGGDAELDAFTNLGNGYYRIYDNEGTARSLYYNGSRWTVTSTDHTNNKYSVRLYKYTGMTGGTPGGPVYALIEGNTVYTVTQGSSATKALAAVKAGITGYTATDANGTGKTELSDSDLTWKWKNTFNGNSTGSYWVEISYQGKVLGTVEVKVEPGVVNNYPEYPDEGSVKVNKTGTGIDFQSSGIAQVEISASGVPIKKGADVIVMLDTSSSMTSHNVTGTSTTRAAVLEESLKNLIAQFKTPGDDGQLLDLRVAIADFNGFYGENHNTSGTPYDRDAADMMSDDISYNANSEAQVYTGDGTLGAGAFIPVEDLATSYTLNYTSGTNYDYAMDAIYQMGTAIKESSTEDRDLYVIFMSDGAAMQWNYYHSQGASSLWNNWITGAWTTNQLNLNCNTHAYYYDEVDHNGDGMRNEHRMANAIKGDPTEQFEVIRKVNTLGTPTGETNMYMVPGLGAKMFSISFDAQADTNVTAESMDKSIASLATEQTGATKYYYKVTTADELSHAFDAIGSEIAYAAYNARFVDQMGDDYNLQMSTSNYSVVDGTNTTNKTITPKIEIITYDIYTRQDYLNGTITEDKIGNRKGTFTILETVTFNADGTEAYSDHINDGKTNILADGTQTGYVKGVIYAKTFIYNTNVTAVAVEGVNIPTGKKADGTTTGSTNMLPSETFYWKLGTVQTSELAMRYYVYLEGSMEGTREGGSYPTNEYATLYYDNYLGNSCEKDTVSPVMAWKEANVSYAFYLVDENGNIIVNQTTGQTGSFANKIAVTNPVVYDTILLNNLNSVRSIEVASNEKGILPDGYELYDNSSVYTITINSNTTGQWEIEKSADKVASTYVTQYKVNDASAYSNELSNSTVGDDYTHTVVWFAVVWKVQALPDAVVVDYGLPVDISVLTNDMFGEKGKLAGVGAYSDSLNLDGHDTNLASGFGENYTGTYGNAKADTSTGRVRYTLNSMKMNGYEKFAYAVNYTGNETTGYYYDTVTVIPATTIYYEDTFMTYSKGSETANQYGYIEKGWSKVGDTLDKTQDEDRPGQFSLTDANNIYGFDSAYKDSDMYVYSMGSSMKTSLTTNEYATATFDFYGTGFDLISLTSNTTGTLTVAVSKYGEDNILQSVKNLVVDTYYGYTYNETTGTWEVTNTINNSIYQVPVIQVENLEYAKYNVVVTASYSEYFDHTGTANTNGSVDGYDLYIDAVRIYDPAGVVSGVENETIENAYEADKEQWPLYLELRTELIDANKFNDSTDTTVNGIVFIDGKTEVKDADLANYTNYGPNNEVYLNAGQAIAFNLNLDGFVDANGNSIIADVHLGAKSANGKEVVFEVYNIAKKDEESDIAHGHVTKTLSTSTDMYYSINALKNGIIVIKNNSSNGNILSLTDIKVTFTQNPYGISTSNLFSVDEEMVTYTLRSLNYVAPTTFAPEVFEVTADETVEVGTNVNVNVITSTDVEYIYVNDSIVSSYVENDGLRTFTTSVPTTEIGTMEVYVQAYNVDGLEAETQCYAEVEVTEKTFTPKTFEVDAPYAELINKKFKVTVKTSTDVEYITVNGETFTSYKTNKAKGTRTWTINLTAKQVGKFNVDVVAYDKDNTASETITEIVEITSVKKIIKDIIDWIFG